jgi:hypothetical protein
MASSKRALFSSSSAVAADAADLSVFSGLDMSTLNDVQTTQPGGDWDTDFENMLGGEDDAFQATPMKKLMSQGMMHSPPSVSDLQLQQQTTTTSMTLREFCESPNWSSTWKDRGKDNKDKKGKGKGKGKAKGKGKGKAKANAVAGAKAPEDVHVLIESFIVYANRLFPQTMCNRCEKKHSLSCSDPDHLDTLLGVRGNKYDVQHFNDFAVPRYVVQYNGRRALWQEAEAAKGVLRELKRQNAMILVQTVRGATFKEVADFLYDVVPPVE